MSIVGIDIHEFNTCNDLLNHVLHDPMWERRVWKYRGQGNKDHALVPSVLRADMAESNREQIVREWFQLKMFAHYSDQQGLYVPGFATAKDVSTIHHLVKRCTNGEEGWPPNKIHGLMALAQHYGIRTRILDWARAPLVGIYFAARYAAEETQPEKSQVTLYALSEDINQIYIRADLMHKHYFATLETRLYGIDVPYEGNQNITAQRGTFTCVVDRQLNPEGAVPCRKVDDIVVELANTVNVLEDSAFDIMHQSDPLMVKLTAPGDGAWDLLHKLSSRFQVNGTRLFTGYYGAARSVMDMQLGDMKHLDTYASQDLDYMSLLHGLSST